MADSPNITIVPAPSRRQLLTAFATVPALAMPAAAMALQPASPASLSHEDREALLRRYCAFLFNEYALALAEINPGYKENPDENAEFNILITDLYSRRGDLLPISWFPDGYDDIEAKVWGGSALTRAAAVLRAAGC